MLFPIQEVIFAESQGTTPWLSPRRTSSITVVCAKVRSRDTDLLHFWAGEGGGPVGGDGMEGGRVGLGAVGGRGLPYSARWWGHDARCRGARGGGGGRLPLAASGRRKPGPGRPGSRPIRPARPGPAGSELEGLAVDVEAVLRRRDQRLPLLPAPPTQVARVFARSAYTARGRRGGRRAGRGRAAAPACAGSRAAVSLVGEGLPVVPSSRLPPLCGRKSSEEPISTG